MSKKKLQLRKTRQTKQARSVSKQTPARISPQKKYSQAIKRIIRKQQESIEFKRAAERERKARAAKETAEKRIKEARKSIRTQKEVSKSAAREIKLAKAARSKAVKVAKETAQKLKREVQAIKKDSKRLYRLLGKKVPKKREIETVIKEQKERKKRRRVEGESGRKLSPEQVIEQAIDELAKGSGFRSAITEREFDSIAGIVKITIRGKNYTRVITGKIADRRGSKILKWQWTSKRQRG